MMNHDDENSSSSQNFCPTLYTKLKSVSGSLLHSCFNVERALPNSGHFPAVLLGFLLMFLLRPTLFW